MLADKSYTAKEIADSPQNLSGVTGYVLIVDNSITSSWNNMVKALNTLAADWQVLQIAAGGNRVIALIHR
jgi:hypothetical protein